MQQQCNNSLFSSCQPIRLYGQILFLQVCVHCIAVYLEILSWLMILKSAVRRCCKDWIWNAMPVCVCCGLYQAARRSVRECVCGGMCVCGWVVYKNDHVVKPGCQGRCDAVCLIGNVGIVIFYCTLSQNVLFFPSLFQVPSGALCLCWLGTGGVEQLKYLTLSTFPNALKRMRKARLN